MAWPEGSPNYPSYLHSYMHPERLALMAKFRGMSPPPFESARMLEVGCASAVSLVSFAKDLPKAHFSGFDLDPAEIGLAREFAAAADVKNVRLEPGDIGEFDGGWGPFDYIAAHGVLSWIPPALRRRFFEICRDQLAPNGVVYVSFNAYPGCHLRDMMRNLLLFHTRDIGDTTERVKQVQAVLKFAAKLDSTQPYGQLFQAEAKTVLERQPEQVLFDEVAPYADPFYLHEVLSLAAEFGFQYLSESDYGDMASYRVAPPVRDLLASIPDWPTRMQYRDFFSGCRFHKLLLCRDNVRLSADILPQVIAETFIAAPIQCDEAEVNLNRDGEEVEFRGDKEATIRTADPMVKAALVMLEEWHPRRVSFTNLCEEVARALGKKPGNKDVREHLSKLVLQLWGMSSANLTLHAPDMAWEWTEKPRASAIARWQARRGTDAASLLCAMIKLEDEQDAQLLDLLDGTRTLSEARTAVKISDREFNRRTQRFLQFGLIERA